MNDWTRLWTKVSAGQVFGNHASLTRGSLTSRAFVLGYRSRASHHRHRHDRGLPIAGAAVVATPTTG